MTINLHLPAKSETLRPSITVIGVGGAGGNAVNNMIAANLEGVNFVVANTDAQALDNSLTDRTIQLGASITRGLGAGASPDVGRAAAEESLDELAAHIEGSNMLFITAGMGGGTGTGAAPVVARMAREQGILTVGVVTKPFQFEGTHRMRLAEAGLEELQSYVDTLIVIPNQNLFRVANERTTFADAFRMADEVLHSGVRGVTDLMVKPGLVNLDFADIRTVMREMGKAMMGTGEATGDRRAVESAEAAISNPLLDDVSLKGAKAVLINITGGLDMTLFEVDEAANRIRDEVDPDANIIFGSTFSDTMEGRMRVSVVATGIEAQANVSANPRSTSVTQESRKPYTVMPVAHHPEKSYPATEVKAQGKSEARSDASGAYTRTAPIPPRFASSSPTSSQEAKAHSPLPLVSQGDFNFRTAPEPHTTSIQAPAKMAFAWPRVNTAIGATRNQKPESRIQNPEFSKEPAARGEDRSSNEPQLNQAAFQASAGMRSGESKNSISPRQQQPREVREERDPAGTGFFQRMGGLRGALSTASTPRASIFAKATEDTLEDESDSGSGGTTTRRAPVAQELRSVQAMERPRPAVASPKPSEEEYLDIPAFLRRQAN